MSSVPPGWAGLGLAEVVSLKTGPFGSALHKSDYVTGGIPLINPSHIRNGRLDPDPNVSVDAKAKERLSEYCLRENDVVMGRRGEMGRCAVVNLEAAGWLCGTGSVIVRPSPAIQAPFLQRFLSAPATVETLNGDSVGSTMVNLNQGVLLGLPIELPPLNEQQRIANKLDTVLARVDACRDRLARVAPLLKRFRQSVLAAATSGRLTEDWRDAARISWRPARRTLADVAEVVTGSTPSKKEPANFGDAVPFFKPSDLDQGYAVAEASEYLSATGARLARMLPAQTVLVTCIGATIGKTGLARVSCTTNQQINALVARSTIVVPGWLYFWCCSPIGQQSIVENSSATTLPILNKSRFSALEADVPSLAEQAEIIRRVETLFAYADRLEARLAQAQAAVNRLTPSLLAKAFRGELVPQDPADEPAAELLKRLAASRTAPVAKTRKPRQGQAA